MVLPLLAHFAWSPPSPWTHIQAYVFSVALTELLRPGGPADPYFDVPYSTLEGFWRDPDFEDEPFSAEIIRTQVFNPRGEHPHVVHWCAAAYAQTLDVEFTGYVRVFYSDALLSIAGLGGDDDGDPYGIKGTT